VGEESIVIAGHNDHALDDTQPETERPSNTAVTSQPSDMTVRLP